MASDDQGYIHCDDPDTLFMGCWDIYEFERAWNLENISATDGMVKVLSGRLAAMK